jgi:hypothetical protein
MTPSQVSSEINRFIQALSDENLILDRNITRVDRSGIIDQVTWINSLKQPPFWRSHFGTISEYIRFVKHRHYSCMLIDGALIQIEFTFENSDLSKHRLCYYPCPFTLDTSRIFSEENIGLLELISECLIDEFDSIDKSIDDTFYPSYEPISACLRMKSPIRFDYDLKSASDKHSASHLHFNDGETRWPVFGPLSLGHFIHFIFRQFYQDKWDSFETLKDWPIQTHGRSIIPVDEKTLFIECHRKSPLSAPTKSAKR